MPLPTFVLLAFGIGAAAALAATRELRFSPRHALATESFKAFVLFVALVLIPVSCYFYVFHGDWFLLYAVDVRRVPSALAVAAIGLECLVGILGFAAGAALTRSQRRGVGMVLVVGAVLGALAVLLVWRDRLTVVGTYSQFRGDYGLEPFGGALMQGAFSLGGLVLLAALYLVARIRYSQRRNGT